MIKTNIPNVDKVTVESLPAAQGGGWIVVAILWSIDETAQQDKRWVRFVTEEEADREAERLAGATWNEIRAWYKKA